LVFAILGIIASMAYVFGVEYFTSLRKEWDVK